MKKILKLVGWWIVLFVPVSVLVSTTIYGFVKINEGYLNSNIGKKFELNNVVNTLENKVALNFNNKITIIDFWFVGCGFCVNEMNQFNALLKGRENEVSVYSISVDAAEYWKTPNSPFLNNTSSNWKFYGLESKSLGQNRRNLNNSFNVKLFPSYIVVDDKGIIIDVPQSAVAYIKENYCYKNWILFFWNEGLFTKEHILFDVMFIPYSILFWLTILIASIVKMRANNRIKAHNAWQIE